ncbi:MAG: winged helix-turn-helix domain-containing protein [Anaerolineales bacterium]|nr:winged helix-turn-helix domain-containing protein [Anaerolineales bacterium]
MKDLVIPFPELADQIFTHLEDGQCVSLTGLSNSGKSALMRSLASPIALERCQKARGSAGVMVYVDCNRAVAISAQAFYEVVIRSILERVGEELPESLANALRDYHQSITEAANAFSASLSFNLALTDLCEGFNQNICLLLDEFDEIYAALDDRALLNLRALCDCFSDRLVLVTATVRELKALRGREFADEFAELFIHSTYPLPALKDEEIDVLLAGLQLPFLDEERRKLCKEFGGGHQGLIYAAAQALGNASHNRQEDPFQLVVREPQPRAESLKIWNQLTDSEQQALTSLVLEQDAGLPKHQLSALERIGMIRNGQIFSPIFEDFVARRVRRPDIASEGVHLDSDSGDVWVDGIRIPVLTDLEFKLLNLLYERMDKVTDKYRIVTAVWGEAYLGDVDDARVEKLVSRLRSKIESDPSNPRYLVTLRGRGYKLLSHAVTV